MSVTYAGWSSSPAATIDVARIYERHAPEIHDFLARTVHDPATAEDLTQTTFIRLMERGDTVREAEKVRPWLFTVAHNLAVTHVTRRRPADPIEAALAIASGERGPEEEAVAAHAARLVWDAARSLEPRQYAVLDLSVRRGFSVAEIAEVLEITPAHAAVVVHRAREALAQSIRLLVVVRQRRHCERLAELIPAGTEVLTPDLRASADRHMRRCEVCKEVGEKLTEPVELFAALPLLPLSLAVHPVTLFPGIAHGVHASATAAHAAPAAGAATQASALAHTAGRHVQAAGQRVVQLAAQPAVLAGVAALAIAGSGVGLGLALHGGGSHSAPTTGQAHGGTASNDNAQVIPPTTGGPGPAVSDARQVATTQNDNSTPGSTPAVPIDTVVDDTPLQSPRTSPPSPTPTPAPPAPLVDQTVLVPVVNAGARVRVYDPRTSSDPVVVDPIVPPIPVGASRIRSF